MIESIYKGLSIPQQGSGLRKNHSLEGLSPFLRLSFKKTNCSSEGRRHKTSSAKGEVPSPLAEEVLCRLPSEEQFVRSGEMCKHM